MSSADMAASTMCMVRSRDNQSVLDVMKFEDKYGGHYAASGPEHRAENQLWYVVEKGEEVMFISVDTKNLLDEWTDDEEWIENGYYVGTSQPHGEATQLWRIEGDVHNCMLRNKASGCVLDLCLWDDWWLGHAVGCCPSHGKKNQRWSLEAVFQHEVVSVEYALDKKVILESKPVVLFSMDCTNGDDEPCTTVVGREVQESNKHQWHFQWDATHKFFWMLAAELEMPAPAVAELGAESGGGEHNIKVERDNGATSWTSVKFNLSHSVNMLAKSSKNLTVKSSKTKLEVPFVAQLKIKNMHTGESEDAEVAGVWQGVVLHGFGVEVSANQPL